MTQPQLPHAVGKDSDIVHLIQKATGTQRRLVYKFGKLLLIYRIILSNLRKNQLWQKIKKEGYKYPLAVTKK